MKHLAPQFIVNNVVASVAYYKKHFGFSIEWMHETNPRFAILSRGGVTLMFRQLNQDGFIRPNRLAFQESGWHHNNGKETWDAYVWVDNVKELYQQCLVAELKIIKSLTKTEYGNLDFEIEDINGYNLCFGQSLDD